jgi:alpha-galactosidase
MQIDDGYQQHMGDWLSSSDQLGVPLHDLLDQLADTGIDMALWIAPFSASASSDILKEHPEWFVKDELTVEI